MAPVIHPAPPGDRTPVPAGFGVRADPSLVDLGRDALLGGNPVRLVRLRPPAPELLARWLGGAPVGPAPTEGLLARRLISQGLLEPEPPEPGLSPEDVTVVVPVRDRPGPLTDLLAALGDLDVVVVDDGSRRPDLTARVAHSAGARCRMLPESRGPGGARDAGLETVSRPVVVFLDSDTVPAPGWLPILLGHFEDPVVGAVAPRIRPVERRGRGLLDAYDARRSPLDRGDIAGLVRPASRIPFVPTACLAVRRSAVGAACFDHSLVGGEDVDLVWRLAEAGWDVRYEPRAVVRHHRDDVLGGWVLRRAFYGTTAGPLARRHPGALAPVSLNGWTVAAWASVAAGHPLVGTGLVAAAVAVLARRLDGVVERPVAVAVRIAGLGSLRSVVPAAGGTARAWGPAIAAGLLWRRTRVVSATWLVLPAVADWVAGRSEATEVAATESPTARAMAPVAFVAVHVLDDLAYAAGVWVGCLRARTLRPLTPRVTLRSGPWSRRAGWRGTGPGAPGAARGKRRSAGRPSA